MARFVPQHVLQLLRGDEPTQKRNLYLKTFLYLVAGIIILQTIPIIGLGPGNVNNIHVYQALGFLNGEVYLPFLERGSHFDVAFRDGRYLCPFPPFPAIVLMPFAAVFGEATRVVPVSLALTAIGVVAFTQLLKVLAVESRFIPWIVAAFFLGSPYWGVVRGSAIGSYFSHVVAVTGTLLALNEAFGRGRGMLVGLFIGLSFLSRQLSIYSTIFLSAALWQNSRFNSTQQRLGSLLAFGSAFGVAVAVYLTFNWLRFGSAFDTGYSTWAETDAFMVDRLKQYGNFHPMYFFHNFVYMFIQGFHLEFSPPMYLDKPHADPFGTSLTFASPFVFFAFKAKAKRTLLWSAWASVSLCLLHMLFYFGNGWVQENGIRYALDFFPVLIVLVALGVRNVQNDILWKGAIGYSIGLNLLAFSLISLAWDMFIYVGQWGKSLLKTLS
jgi:hypothetical protein